MHIFCPFCNFRVSGNLRVFLVLEEELPGGRPWQLKDWMNCGEGGSHKCSINYRIFSRNWCIAWQQALSRQAIRVTIMLGDCIIHEVYYKTGIIMLGINMEFSWRDWGLGSKTKICNTIWIYLATTWTINMDRLCCAILET